MRFGKLPQVTASRSPIVKPIPKRLLFVDDEPNIRATLPVILRRYGFMVTVAGTVSQALKHIRENRFDLLLCDLNIEHESDGLEVIRAMGEANPSCVKIILTAYPAFESAVEGIHLGIDDYITKPTNADALVAVLAEKLTARPPKARVLTISNDEPALETWRLLLESKGHEVVTSSGAGALKQCANGPYDVFILGRSVPETERKKLVEGLRGCCPAPVISVFPADVTPNDGADFHYKPNPEEVLKRITEIVMKKSAAKSSGS
jgi:DNA-binding response OmpR family regulator